MQREVGLPYLKITQTQKKKKGIVFSSAGKTLTCHWVHVNFLFYCIEPVYVTYRWMDVNKLL